ncbi:hypothetical protein BH20VER3_BH20VER3_16460 [soil metagenome]
MSESMGKLWYALSVTVEGWVQSEDLAVIWV